MQDELLSFVPGEKIVDTVATRFMRAHNVDALPEMGEGGEVWNPWFDAVANILEFALGIVVVCVYCARV